MHFYRDILFLLAAIPSTAKEATAVILVFTDPAAMGLFFMGAMVLFEKSQRIESSLAVAPIKISEYIFGKVLPLMVVGIMVGTILCLFAGIKNTFLALLGVALSSVLLSLCGLLVGSNIKTLNGFMIATVPFEIIICVPALLFFFGILKSELWFFHPGVSAICMIRGDVSHWYWAALSLMLWFDTAQILAPYYIIFDLLLAVMTPILFCFAGVLVILEELDWGVAKYYAVTPIGKSGYLLSRIGIPALIALVYNAALLCVFSTSNIDFVMIILLSISGGLTAVLTSLFVVSFAKNKMEGMALIKLCGLLLIGIPVAYFVVSPVRYLFGVFPSFWMAELCMTQNYRYFIPAVLLSALLIWGLYGRFHKRLL